MTLQQLEAYFAERIREVPGYRGPTARQLAQQVRSSQRVIDWAEENPEQAAEVYGMAVTLPFGGLGAAGRVVGGVGRRVAPALGRAGTRALKKVTPAARSLGERVARSAPAQRVRESAAGRGVAGAARKVTPRRPAGKGKLAARPEHAPAPPQLSAAVGRQIGSTRLPLAPGQRGFLRETLATVTERGMRPGRPFVPRPLTGPRGVMGRLGFSPAARGTTSIGLKAVAGAHLTSEYLMALSYALGFGVAADVRQRLGQETDDEAAQRALEEALEAAQRGDLSRAAQLLADAGVDPEVLDVIVAESINEQQSREGPLRDSTGDLLHGGAGPRTVQGAIDSLTEYAGSGAGLPPTVARALQAEHDAHMLLDDAEYVGGLAAAGLLPANFVLEGFTEQHHDFGPTGPSTFVPGFHPPKPVSIPDLRQANQVVGELFTMTQDEIVDLQHKLFAGGFYGATPYDNIEIGRRDPALFSAFQRFLEQAAHHTQFTLAQSEEGDFTGLVTWRDLLETWALESGVIPGEEPEERPTYVVSLTDPSAIRRHLDNLATNIIGRGVSPSVQQRFVGMYHAQQRSSQVAAQSAAHERPGESVEVTHPDVAGQGEDFLRGQFPVEARSHELVRQYGAFLDMIGARGGV